MGVFNFIKQPASRAIARQSIAYTASSQGGTKFGTETYQVKLVATSACNYIIGDGAQTATTSTSTQTGVSDFLPANTVVFETVTPGQFIAAIQATTNGLITGTAGTLFVTEMG